MAEPFTISPSRVTKAGEPAERVAPVYVKLPVKAPVDDAAVDHTGARPGDAVGARDSADEPSNDMAGGEESNDSTNSIEPPDPLDTLVQDADITTPWFDPETKPVHQGVYQRRFPGGPYSCWDGTRWFGDATNAARAASADAPSPHQDIGWRGLVSASAAPCLSCRGHGVVDLGVDEESGNDLMQPCEEC